LTTIQDFTKQGQSIWYDYLRRSFITSGELKELIDEGLRGVTSNPTIFENAISGSTDYDTALRRLALEKKSVREIYEALILDDITKTADLFRFTYDDLKGADGFVSIEVDPKLANNARGMIDEGRRFFKAINRPNVMIKIPATEAGFPAIEALISEGINVNVTLIFSPSQYAKAAEAYISGLEKLSETRKDLSLISSVASFFVSRVDTNVDKALEEKGEKSLQGKIAIANAKIAYSKFKETISGERWERLKSKGARVQRVLWASTGTKNPLYSDTMYVDNLIGPETINTVPPATLKAVLDHGRVANTLESGLDTAREDMKLLSNAGIDFEKIMVDLEEEGVSKFTKSIEVLFEKIAQKRERFIAEPYLVPPSLGQYQEQVDSALNDLSADNIVRRIWNHDYTVWGSAPDEISNRLGWLEISEVMEENIHRLEDLVDSVKVAGYEYVLLLGMGGSSLAPLTFAKTFGVGEKFLQLSVLDSTDPSTILAFSNGLDLEKTLFIVSSKSGKTIETISLFKYFYNKTAEALGRENAGQHFLTITDAGSELENISDMYKFRAKFLNDPNLGGRYSALSYFGLVPAALVGVDILRLLDNAMTAASTCESSIHIKDNPGATLGATMGELALIGRNKLTLVASPSIESLCDWIEQLIAESTGKNGKGILPIVREPIGPPEVYDNDRLFVYLKEGGDSTLDGAVSDLEAAGHPVVRLTIRDPYEIGKQFFLWEFATAIAGHILGINPFDQPDVESAKQLAKEIVSSYIEKGTFPPETPSLTSDGIRVYGNISADNPAEAILSFIEKEKRKGSYIALQPYLQSTPETGNALEAIRTQLRDRFKIATTLGYGPRFLHSTGQEHKGDAGLGIFIQFTYDDRKDLAVPDNIATSSSLVTFGVLKMAAALGDRKALLGKGRPVIRLHLDKDVDKCLTYLEKTLSSKKFQVGDEDNRLSVSNSENGN
jgi:transaldolase / glucose-6-phosphate isomerase